MFFSFQVIGTGDIWVKLRRDFSCFIRWLDLACDLVHAIIPVFLNVIENTKLV